MWKMVGIRARNAQDDEAVFMFELFELEFSDLVLSGGFVETLLIWERLMRKLCFC